MKLPFPLFSCYGKPRENKGKLRFLRSFSRCFAGHKKYLKFRRRINYSVCNFLTDMIISFLVVLARWLKTNTSPVCFGARYHHYATFYVPRGLLAAIKRFTFTVSCLVTLEALTTGLSGSVDTMAGDIRKFSNTENVHQHRECATKFLQILSFFILLTFVYTFVEGKMFLAP